MLTWRLDIEKHTTLLGIILGLQYYIHGTLSQTKWPTLKLHALRHNYNYLKLWHYLSCAICSADRQHSINRKLCPYHSNSLGDYLYPAPSPLPTIVYTFRIRTANPYPTVVGKLLFMLHQSSLHAYEYHAIS